MRGHIMPGAIAALLLLLLTTTPAFSSELPALDDQELSLVTGQEGIAIDLELRVNADSSGTPLSSLGNCEGTGNPCLMAIQIGNRNAGGGEWLSIKDLYGVMRINDLQLDGGRLPDETSDYPNLSRFLATDGSCLLDGSLSPGDCQPNDRLAAVFSFPETSGFNADVEWFLNVGRMSVQFGEEGYWAANDDGASFVGIRIADMVNDVAEIDVGGRVYFYGF